MSTPRPENLSLALHLANARLRAWKAAGVPVEGEWAFDPPWYPLPGLRLVCRFCKSKRSPGRFHPLGGRSLEEAERIVVGNWIQDGCTHLAPLLGPMPEEVAAVWELEIVAGE